MPPFKVKAIYIRMQFFQNNLIPIQGHHLLPNDIKVFKNDYNFNSQDFIICISNKKDRAGNMKKRFG